MTDERHETVIAALLHSRTHEAAAEAVGISTATLRRLLADDGFQAAYRAARRQVVEVAIGRLQQLTAEAVETLERNLTCGNAAVEVRAAAVLLEKAVEGVELADLLEQVEELRARIEAAKGVKR